MHTTLLIVFNIFLPKPYTTATTWTATEILATTTTTTTTVLTFSYFVLLTTMHLLTPPFPPSSHAVQARHLQATAGVRCCSQRPVRHATSAAVDGKATRRREAPAGCSRPGSSRRWGDLTSHALG